MSLVVAIEVRPIEIINNPRHIQWLTTVHTAGIFSSGRKVRADARLTAGVMAAFPRAGHHGTCALIIGISADRAFSRHVDQLIFCRGFVGV